MKGACVDSLPIAAGGSHTKRHLSFKAGVFVAAGEGFVRVLELQAAGGKRLRAADFVNGRKAAAGDVFGGAAQ